MCLVKSVEEQDEALYKATGDNAVDYAVTYCEFMYQANVLEKRLQIFPMFKKQEALDLFEGNKSSDRKRGFRIVQLE